MPDNDSQIGQVLIDKKFKTEDVKQLVVAFGDKQTIGDLGTELSAATKAIDDALKLTKLSADTQGKVKTVLLEVWRASNPTAPGTSTGTTPGTSTTTTPDTSTGTTPGTTTNVPPGNVDITAPDFKFTAEKDGTIQTFTIPDIFKASAKDFVPASQVKPWQWIHIARNNNLTTALSLTNLFKPGSGNPYAPLPAFVWEKRSGGVTDNAEGYAGSRVSSSIDEGQAHNHLLAEASIAGEYGFCNASVKASYRMDADQRSYSKVIKVRARYQQNRCIVTLENCLRPAPILIYLLECGLAKDLKPEDQFEYFAQLFDKFGHAVPNAVYLGALAEISRDFISIADQSKKTTETKVNTAVGVRAKQGSAEGNVGFNMSTLQMTAAANCIENISFRSIGGAPGAVTDLPEWLKSTNNPSWWKTILRADVKPIQDFLDFKHREAIRVIFEKKKNEAWQNPIAVQAANADQKDKAFEFPTSRILPFVPFDHDVTLRCMLPRLDGNSDQVYLKACNGVTDRPDDRACVEDGRNIDGVQVAPGDPCRIKGFTYSWCQPAPPRAGLGAGDTPDATMCWRLVYTGHCDSDHEPFFWIVTKDEQWALSAYNVEGWAFACLIPYKEAQRLRSVNSPCRWVLETAIPPGDLELPALPDQNSGYFRIRNRYWPAYLADLISISSSNSGSKRKYIRNESVWAQYGPFDPYGHREFKDVTHEEDGPVFDRTILRVQEDLTFPPYDANNEEANKAKRNEQKRLFQSRCWLIQDRSAVMKPKHFDVLETNYIQDKILQFQSRPPIIVKVRPELDLARLKEWQWDEGEEVTIGIGWESKDGTKLLNWSNTCLEVKPGMKEAAEKAETSSAALNWDQIVANYAPEKIVNTTAPLANKEKNGDRMFCEMMIPAELIQQGAGFRFTIRLVDDGEEVWNHSEEVLFKNYKKGDTLFEFPEGPVSRITMQMKGGTWVSPKH